MLKRLSRQVAVILLLVGSLGWTAHLGQDYLQAVFGPPPPAQWQFAFVMAPIPVLLGAVALVIAKFLLHRSRDCS